MSIPAFTDPHQQSFVAAAVLPRDQPRDIEQVVHDLPAFGAQIVGPVLQERRDGAPGPSDAALECPAVFLTW